MPNLFPDPVNLSGTVGVFDYANDITGQAFMPLILFVIWIILFTIFKTSGQGETRPALGSSLFVTMILSIILRAGNLVTDAVVVVMIFAFLGASVFIIMERDKF